MSNHDDYDLDEFPSFNENEYDNPDTIERVLEEVPTCLKREQIGNPGTAEIIRCMRNYPTWSYESIIQENIKNIVKDIKAKVGSLPRKESIPRKIVSSNSGEAFATTTKVMPLVKIVRQKFWGTSEAPFASSRKGRLQALKWLRQAKAEAEADRENNPPRKLSLSFTVESGSAADETKHPIVELDNAWIGSDNRALLTDMRLYSVLLRTPKVVHEAEEALRSLTRSQSNTRVKRQPEEENAELLDQARKLMPEMLINFPAPSNATTYFKHLADYLEGINLEVTDFQLTAPQPRLALPTGENTLVSFPVSHGTRLADLAEWVMAVVKLSCWWADYEALAFIMCGRTPIHGIEVNIQNSEDEVPEAITLTIRGPATEAEVRSIYKSILQEYHLEPKKLSHVHSEILRLVHETPHLKWPKRYQKWLEWCDKDETLPDYDRDPKEGYRALRKEYVERALQRIGWQRSPRKTKKNHSANLKEEVVSNLQRGFSLQKLPKDPMDTD